MTKLAKMNTPIFWAEGHPGALDRENWTLKVHGSCKEPQIFSWQELQEMPQVRVEARLTSVTRWSVFGAWTGVSFDEILRRVQVSDSCKYLRFWSVGHIYDTSIPRSIAEKERSLIAWAFDDELLSEDYGGPIRALIPYLWGYKSAKSMIEIELMDYYVPGFWEMRGYTDSGKIEAGVCRDINDGGKIKKIPDGEVKDFV